MCLKQDKYKMKTSCSEKLYEDGADVCFLLWSFQLRAELNKHQ